VLHVASCVCTLARGGAPQLAVQGLGGASQPLYEVAPLLVKGAEVVRCLRSPARHVFAAADAADLSVLRELAAPACPGRCNNHLGQEQEQNEGDPCVTNCSRSVIAWVALYEQSGRLAQAIDAKP
jgi:hypothetical protein